MYSMLDTYSVSSTVIYNTVFPYKNPIRYVLYYPHSVDREIKGQEVMKLVQYAQLLMVNLLGSAGP